MRSHDRWFLIATILCLAAIAAFLPVFRAAGLGGDEYLNFGLLWSKGWRYLAHSIVWSPRPVAQLLLLLDAGAVAATGQPLAVAFAAFLLSGLAFSMWVGALHGGRSAFLLVASLLALFLAGRPLGQMFLRPEAGAAYVPTLACFAFVVLRETSDESPSMPITAAALSIAALSSEVGAITTLCAVSSVAARNWRAGVCPTVCAVAVLAAVIWGRTGHHEIAGPEPLLLAFRHAALAFPSDMIAANARATPASLMAGAAIKLIFLIGCGLAFKLYPRPLLATGLLAGAFLTVAAAYREFGMLCCERHDTLRQGFAFLALLCVAGLIAAVLPPQRRLGICFIALSVTGAVAWRWPRLMHDWQAVPGIVAAERITWDSGRAPGPRMVFVRPPQPIVETAWPSGTYSLEAHPPWYVRGVLLFFGKQSVRFIP